MGAPGTVAYIPDAKFAFPRSYIQGIQIGIGDGWIIEETGNPFLAHYSIVGFDQFIRVTMDNRFYVWSSNIYTLDFVFTEMVTWFTGSPIPVPFANDVRFCQRDNPLCQDICIDLPGATKVFRVLLPIATSAYWTAQPTCPEELS
jgi:hypothetical protein